MGLENAKVIWSLNWCLLAKNADQCKFVNE